MWICLDPTFSLATLKSLEANSSHVGPVCAEMLGHKPQAVLLLFLPSRNEPGNLFPVPPTGPARNLVAQENIKRSTSGDCSVLIGPRALKLAWIQPSCQCSPKARKLHRQRRTETFLKDQPLANQVFTKLCKTPDKRRKPRLSEGM